MDVISFCPLRVSSILWQPRPGAHALTVACKATYELRPGTSALAAEQEPPWEEDVYSDDDRSRLCAASDLAPFKRKADVLVVGHVYAPRRPSARVPVARIVVGRLEKAVEVRAERVPAGLLGLGPIAPERIARTAMLGRHAATWDHRAWNTRPLPEDIDGAFFNAASADQQLPDLAGDEPIVLELLHPSHTRLATRLSCVVPRALVQRANTAPQESRLRCDTLTIDADRGLAMLVWRGVVVLAHPSEDGRVVVTAAIDDESARATPSLIAPARTCRVGDLGAEGGEADASGDLSEQSSEEVATTTIPLHTQRGANPVLPFVPGSFDDASVGSDNEPHAPRASWPADSEEDAGTGTTFLPYADVQPTLEPVMPFRQESPRATEAPAPLPDRHERSALEPIAHAQLDVPPPAMVLDVPPPAMVEEIRPTEARVVEEPPMIGPLAGVAAAVPASEPGVVVAERPTFDVPATEPEPAEVELSIGQCAAIAAEIAEGRAERARVLEAHELGERTWRENERRWQVAIAEEAGTGKQALRRAYDAAYVARIEAFRGPITMEEYMRIVVGLERGRAEAALDALRIQRPALMPIVRWWTKRVAEDTKMADKAPDALRGARKG
ncbi:hypothetical protein predicted by Glimmer/Critica [Sorangium cellulosum So ce56]|uniref:DUF2169 domain-containing protein n=1 Tax=Sorangium cellulosum (strain So ce56) TaxID=448385 RepID=A9EVS0_SORC5|nr:DUF2169 domain-containing protein [Sorangium cellulosum]CAN94251.1 hypothetical protein predicted by Glimmer/Critica [Sorangium cellulosum So ce56]